MMLRNSIWTFIVLIILSSCVTQKKCSDKFPCVIFTKELIKDSIIIVNDTIYQPYEEIQFNDAVPCPPEVVYHKSVTSKGITATVDIKDGKITAICKEDSLMKIIEIQKHLQTKTITLTNTETKFVRDAWYYFWRAGFWICIGLLSLTIAGLIYVK